MPKKLDERLTEKNLKLLRKKYKISTIAEKTGKSESWIKVLLRRYKMTNRRK